MPRRSPFVLLHGGRHGGWCWRKLTPLLRAAGHDVYTPTLTGLGERSHLLDRSVGLGTHIDDLVATFEYEDITDAILVGHSYGGFVTSGAMERLADRVKFVVLLDGHLAKQGESVLYLNGVAREAAMTQLAREHGDGWFVPPADASRYGVTDPDDIEWANARMTAQPLKTYQDPIGPTDSMWRHPGLFIECNPSSLEADLLKRTRQRSIDDPAFGYAVLNASHNAMVTDPVAVAELLLRSAL
ncbi:alpha/beta fold hydrolase [Rhodococcoides fascians]|uniref:alpha/beta fold hydrolase n=1 Tax=Rhodococcoides fascians TaxID=1828 RepID=UPI000562F972|nr:alpha/beta fold hydrolase [Rhodococcus fascians]